jgi:membrane protein YqaA with SNARE-associated domain
MPLVDAWMGNVIAVAGTLLGSVAGYVFQRLNAGRTERFARDERLRQERMAAYSGYAGAVTDLRRAVVSLWFLLQRTDSGDAERRAAYTDADRFGCG